MSILKIFLWFRRKDAILILNFECWIFNFFLKPKIATEVLSREIVFVVFLPNFLTF
jgi:hypothetical protein